MLKINPAVAAIEEETAFTVLDRANALKAKGHPVYRMSLRDVTKAVAVDAATAELLKLPAGSPGLQIERRAFLADGRAVEFTRSVYRADAYDFVAELTRG